MRPSLRITTLVFVLGWLVACATAAPSPTVTSAPAATPWPTPAPTLAQSLRGAAFSHNILVGAAVQPALIQKDPQYAATLAREYSALTPENAMKFGPLRPTRTAFNFDDADFLVNFAQAHGMKVRGHTLIWHKQLPDWLTSGTFTRDELIAIMREHISTVVGRYRGRIYAWDVVNEAIADDGTGNLRDTIWSKGIGPDYIDMAFKLAHEADPDAKLFYNDFDAEGSGPKSDAVYALVKGMKERGVPIDGVGFQSHFKLGQLPDAADVDANMKRLAALGLQVQVTELDIRINLPNTDEDLQDQASQYRGYLQVCLDNSNCTMFVTWGFTDKYSWIPDNYYSQGAALPFDEAYQPKPAYQALMDTLAGK